MREYEGRALKPQVKATSSNQTILLDYKRIIDRMVSDGVLLGDVDIEIISKSDLSPLFDLIIAFENERDLALFFDRHGLDRRDHVSIDEGPYCYYFKTDLTDDTFRWNDYVRGLEALKPDQPAIISRQQDLLTAFTTARDPQEQRNALQAYYNFRSDVAEAYRQRRIEKYGQRCVACEL